MLLQYAFITSAQCSGGAVAAIPATIMPLSIMRVDIIKSSQLGVSRFCSVVLYKGAID
jgi:hypothetical protein